MNLEFIKTKQRGPRIFSFFFNRPAGFKYNPGEYIELSLDIKHPDERGSRRWFTLSSSPTEDFLFITTKFAPAQGSVFKDHLKKLKPGDKVQISPAMGDFILPKDSSQPIVFVAGGIGVTPYRSMLKYVLDKKLSYDILLIYASNRPEEFVFKDLIADALGKKVTYVVGEPTDGWGGKTGRLDGNNIRDLVKDLKNKLVYLSGPEPMVKTLEEQLLALGQPRHLLKTDDFPGYTSI